MVNLTQQDLWRALVDGKTLFNEPNRTFIKFLDGQQVGRHEGDTKWAKGVAYAIHEPLDWKIITEPIEVWVNVYPNNQFSNAWPIPQAAIDTLSKGGRTVKFREVVDE